MDLALNAEQLQLRDTLSRFLANRKSSSEPDLGLWKDFADTLGILGASYPEAFGGLGGGPEASMIIMEELGSALVKEPYLEAVIIVGSLLQQVGGSRASALLERIATGNVRIVFAHDEERSRFSPERIETTAKRVDNHWFVVGQKIVVVGAPQAKHVILSARTGGKVGDRAGISLFLVSLDHGGITQNNYRLIDGRPASDLTFTDVRLPLDSLMGEVDFAADVIDLALDEGIAGLCAEGVGVMRRMLDDTIEYLRQREQFGQPLSKFQALQHRAVDMYMSVERAIAATYLVTLKLKSDSQERKRAASAAKATIAETIRFVAQNAVQLHGAMGMTDELQLGHYFRRATVIEQQLGTADHHLARYSQLTD